MEPTLGPVSKEHPEGPLWHPGTMHAVQSGLQQGQVVLVVLMFPWFQYKQSLQRAQAIRPLEDLEVSVVTRTSALPWAHRSALLTFSITAKNPVEKLIGWKAYAALQFQRVKSVLPPCTWVAGQGGGSV